MKNLVFIISIFLLGCDYPKPKVSNTLKPNVDTIKFSSRGFNYGHELKLATDSTFIDTELWASCFGGGGTQSVFGTYTKKNGNIVLKPKTIEYFESPMWESDTILENRVANYNPDSVKIETEYFLVEWRRNKYLLSETMDPKIDIDPTSGTKNDFIRFAQYFNSESRRFKFDGFLYKDNEHTCDSLNPKFDYTQIPDKWRKYFLKKPISSEINKAKM